MIFIVTHGLKQRHLLVNFDQNKNQAIWTTLDKIKDQDENTYTWQLNLGDNPNPLISETNIENGINTFTIQGENNSYLKGWVINPNEVEIKIEDPLQVKVSGANTNNIWVVLIVGKGIPPTAKLEGEGINAQLIINNQTIVNYDEKSDRLDIIWD